LISGKGQEKDVNVKDKIHCFIHDYNVE